MVDDIDNENPQKKYADSVKGKRALKKARKKYDSSDPERRKRQKREYMRKARKKNKHRWRKG
mgnify:FL=1|jgi:hypothetical protein|tara:strand:+ start:74 stop:259 length:186 start_codon:yes stop_codon:yes gene_type:complete